MDPDEERARGFGVEGDDEGPDLSDYDEGSTLAYTVARVALGMVPFGGSVDVVIEAARRRTADKVQRTVDDVRSEVGAETLARRLAEDPEVEAVFVQGVEAAARTGYEAKRRALAKVIASAVTDDAAVDESLLFVVALRDLDAPHIRVLARLADVEASALADAESQEEADRNPRDWAMRAVHGAGKEELPSVVSALLRTGCLRGAEVMFANGTEAGGVTDFGRALLAHIRSAAS